MFITSGQASLAYDVVGGGSGAVDVLFVHAGVTDRRSWRHAVDRLTPRHRCITWDQRQFGETTYTVEDGWTGVGDAVAVLDAAGAERVVVVACSMGGALAIDLVLAHPERVSGLVLIGSAVRGATEPEVTDPRVLRLYAQDEAAEEAGDLAEVNRLEAWIWLDGPTVDEGRVAGAVRDLFLDMNGIALAAPEPGEPGDVPDAWPRLGEITVPALVLVGSLDVPEIQAVDIELAERLPQGRLVWLDGVAHLPHLEADPACLDAIAEFVDAGIGSGG